MSSKLVNFCTLSIAIFTDYKDAGSFLDSIHTNNLIVRAQTNTSYATRYSTHWTDIFFIKSYSLAKRSRDDYFVFAGRHMYPTQFITIVKIYGNKSSTANVLILAK